MRADVLKLFRRWSERSRTDFVYSCVLSVPSSVSPQFTLEQTVHDERTLSGMNVGIHALELYFPKCYVEQSELEVHDGVSEGKYTKGLGQRQMSVCDVREDVNSLALTVTSSLLRRYAVRDENALLTSV